MKIAIFILIFLILSVYLACQHVENPSRYFEDYNPEIHNGNWVPNIFPHDISSIYETHDIDTNEVWLRFNTNASRVNKTGYTKLTADEIINMKIRKPFLKSWWFVDIVQHQPFNKNALYANFYKGSCGTNMIAYLAVSKSSNTNYWWCQCE